MRTIKNADVRKNEILNAAASLFQEKGYDGTSTNDILDAVGIARGTLYHHFKSKEDIMDALIGRQAENIAAAARKIADDKSIPVEERMIRTIMSLNVSGQKDGSKIMIEQLHKPQNALMHQKMNQMVLQRIPPILADIIKDGIKEGLFRTSYPLEYMELALIYLKTIIDDDIFDFTPEQFTVRLQAFIFLLEKLLDVEQGRLNYLIKLFDREAQ